MPGNEEHAPQHWWRQRGTQTEIHLIEAMENVERLLRFIAKVSRDPSCPQYKEARAILSDFGRLDAGDAS